MAEADVGAGANGMLLTSLAEVEKPLTDLAAGHLRGNDLPHFKSEEAHFQSTQLHKFKQELCRNHARVLDFVSRHADAVIKLEIWAAQLSAENHRLRSADPGRPLVGEAPLVFSPPGLPMDVAPPKDEAPAMPIEYKSPMSHEILPGSLPGEPEPLAGVLGESSRISEIVAGQPQPGRQSDVSLPRQRTADSSQTSRAGKMSKVDTLDLPDLGDASKSGMMSAEKSMKSRVSFEPYTDRSSNRSDHKAGDFTDVCLSQAPPYDEEQNALRVSHVGSNAGSPHLQRQCAKSQTAIDRFRIRGEWSKDTKGRGVGTGKSFSIIGEYKKSRSRKTDLLLTLDQQAHNTGIATGGGSMSFTELLQAEQEKRKAQKKSSCELLHPSSPLRSCWDIFSLFLVVYDMAAIPLEFFEIPPNTFSAVMTWITRIFWTLDMPATVLTGYVTIEGSIELGFKKTSLRYLKTWFFLDCIIVGVDWFELILSNALEGLGYARVGKASRTFRIIRMIRLLRLVRMKEVFALVTERLNSERVLIMADIIKLMIIILGMAHFIACLWYGVGVAGSNPQDNWVGAHDYLLVSIGSRYAMSLHWSLSQFAGGMDEVTPVNLSERVFAIVVFIIAFVIASIFVSSLTSHMTQLSLIGSHQSQQLSVLRRYLSQNGIPSKLAMRVQRNAQHAMQERKRFMPEKEVAVLDNVSEPLRVEIHLHMYAPIFDIHPFFQDYLVACPQVMRRVCHSSASLAFISSGDIIFNWGEMPAEPKMYFLCAGTMFYQHWSANPATLHEDSWISEASLWTDSWTHQGALMASNDCRICILEANKFIEIVTQFKHTDFDPREYACQFVERLNSAIEEPSDLPFSFEHMEAVKAKDKGSDAKYTFAKAGRFLRGWSVGLKPPGNRRESSEVVTVG